MQLSMVTRREVTQLSMAVLQHGACCVFFSRCFTFPSDPGHCFSPSPVVSGADRMEAGRRGTSAAVCWHLVLRSFMSGTRPRICFQKSSEPTQAPG